MDDTASDNGHDDARGHGANATPDERTTAPMSEFGAREAGIGALVALVGLALAFLLPLLAA